MQDHRYVFTIIHKFKSDHGEKYPKLSDRSDIIVMTDEAHRTQHDILAGNMHDALPDAAFIGFTGTPLIASEEKTKETFGDYVSIYNFSQSVEDNATVPLWAPEKVNKILRSSDIARTPEKYTAMILDLLFSHKIGYETNQHNLRKLLEYYLPISLIPFKGSTMPAVTQSLSYCRVW